jgi:hypothetical protein
MVITPSPSQATIQVTKEMIMGALESFKRDILHTRNSYDAVDEVRLYDVYEANTLNVSLVTTCFVHDRHLNFRSPIYIHTFTNYWPSFIYESSRHTRKLVNSCHPQGVPRAV